MKGFFTSTVIAITLLVGACGSGSESGNTAALQGDWTLDPALLDSFDAFTSESPMDQMTTRAAANAIAGLGATFTADQIIFTMPNGKDGTKYDYTVTNTEGDTVVLQAIRYKGTSREQISEMRLTITGDTMLMVQDDGSPLPFSRK